ncbi:Coat F domain-containing protein [Alteribacillus persepolensis]|uniref:Coat F domain-containing protein n=1 Tax=Alteribacillus persepolensis TaxID=568899 RepID=A0A1G8DUD8_9BACI|nr:spore coat protein [Alteribacillus persepolensis]SDH61314.1 Coat F domain-containing protein [Alteribacillus persepolensis]
MPGSNKIQNPKTEVPQTPEMNDRDFLNDMLTTEKYMTDSYSTAMNEASHQDLYNDISLIFSETQNVQRDLFNLMFKKGWYSFEAADQQTISQTYQQFTGYNSQLPSSDMVQ